MSITPFRFDKVENFLAIRECSGPVELMIAEDDEATINILLKGRLLKCDTCIERIGSILIGSMKSLQTKIIVVGYAMYQLSAKLQICTLRLLLKHTFGHIRLS